MSDKGASSTFLILPFVFFSGLLGEKIMNHLSIPRICDRIITHCHENDKKLYLLGAEPDVNENAINNLRKIYPGIKIMGHHGYFDVNQMTNIINDLLSYAPDVVLVGISSPKKERVILKFSKKYKNSINIACGGYLDIIAGKVNKAPDLIHRMGMEWLFRFFQEPRRMFSPMLLNGLFFLFYFFPKSLIIKYILKENPLLINFVRANDK